MTHHEGLRSVGSSPAPRMGGLAKKLYADRVPCLKGRASCGEVPEVMSRFAFGWCDPHPDGAGQELQDSIEQPARCLAHSGRF